MSLVLQLFILIHLQPAIPALTNISLLQVVRFVALFVRAHLLLAAQPNLPVVYDQFNPFDGKARSFTAAQPQRLGIADSRALGGIQRIQIGPCFNVRPVPELLLYPASVSPPA